MDVTQHVLSTVKITSKCTVSWLDIHVKETLLYPAKKPLLCTGNLFVRVAMVSFLIKA
jgi:hypothetical protein